MAEKKKEELVAKQSAALATTNYQEDAGAGTEGADSASFAIPFTLILQPGSPIVVDGNAKGGQFMNSISEKVQPEIAFIPVAFSRKMVAWVPREKGGGFKGSFTVSEMETMIKMGAFVRNAEGRIVDKEKDPGVIVKDTRQHFILVYDPETETWVESLMALASTQIKVSKRLLTTIQTFKMKNTATGVPFTPASYSRIFHGTTEKKENDKGKWFSLIAEPEKLVDLPWLYEAAKSFSKRIVAGEVKVDMAQSEKAEGKVDASSEEEGGGF